MHSQSSEIMKHWKIRLQKTKQGDQLLPVEIDEEILSGINEGVLSDKTDALGN